MKIQRPHQFTPLVSTALLLGCTLLPSCGGSEPPPKQEPAAKPPTRPQDDPSTKKTIKELFSGASKGSKAHAIVYPDLGFESASSGLPSAGTWREHPLLADLNGDGLDDLVASNREEDGLNVWLRGTDGSWKHSIEGIPRNLMYGGSEAADLNGDGRTDLAFAAHKDHARVFLNRPVDGDPHAVRWEEVEDPLPGSFLGLDIALGNLNGDEFVDAVMIAQFVQPRDEGGLAVFFGRGDGTFERQEQFSTLLGHSRNGHQVELTDMDGNGLDDLFATAEWGALIFMTHLDVETGKVSFEQRSEGLPTPGKMGNSLYAFIPCELTGEPPLEVAFAGLADPTLKLEERNDVGAYRWVDEAWQQFDQGLPRHLAFHEVLSADFDGDGYGDLVLSGPGAAAVLYMGDGQGRFEPLGMFAGTTAGGRGSIGDVDGDGRPDITISVGATKPRPDSGGVQVYLNRAAAFDK